MNVFSFLCLFLLFHYFYLSTHHPSLQSMTTTSDTSHHLSPLIANPQDHFVRLLKDITQLQWVRESLPVQAKYYEGLKQRHERETHLKNLLEKPM